MKKELDEYLVADLIKGLQPGLNITKTLYEADLHSMSVALTGALYHMALEDGEATATDLMFELSHWALIYAQRGLTSIQQKYCPKKYCPNDDQEEEDEDDE